MQLLSLNAKIKNMSEISINTTQNVKINFTAASVGVRIAAFLLDFLIRVAYLIVVYVVLFNVFQLNLVLVKLDRWSVMAVNLVICLPAIFYSLVMESIFEGQTLGKKLMKIKIVKLDGYQSSFSDYLIRWFFAIIDVYAFFGLIGIVSLVSSKNTQCLGDLAAGTTVISIKNDVTINSTIIEELEVEYLPVYPLVIKLSDNDVRIIKETFQKAMDKTDFEMISKLKNKIEQVTGIKNNSRSEIEFVRTVLKDYNYYTQHM